MIEGIEGVGEAVTGGMLARAVEPGSGRGGGPDGDGTASIAAPRWSAPYCHAAARPGHVHRTLDRLLARPRPRRPPFRRQDLADPAAARLAAGRAHPPLCRGRAGQLRLADGAVPVLGVPDVRGVQRDRRPVRRSTATDSCGRAPRPRCGPSASAEREIARASCERARDARGAGKPTAAVDEQHRRHRAPSRPCSKRRPRSSPRPRRGCRRPTSSASSRPRRHRTRIETGSAAARRGDRARRRRNPSLLALQAADQRL